MKSQQMNVVEKLLLAASDLERKGKGTFSAEDLVVAAWQRFPDAFGLTGYYSDKGDLLYPDSNRVFVAIMGSGPIRKKGFLRKVGTKMYQLTEAGHQTVGFLLKKGNQPAISKLGLERDTEIAFKRLLSSKALSKFNNNLKDVITFYDACAFWHISPTSSAIELEGNLANLEMMINHIRNLIQNKTVTFKHGGRAFDSHDINQVENLHKFLLDKFHEELDIIRKRTDERK